MSTKLDTAQEAADRSVALGRRPGLSDGVVWMILGVITAGALLFGTLTGSWYLAALFGVIVALVLVGTISGVSEGGRAAKDRMFTLVIYAAFACAMFPLVTVLWLVVSNGLERFDLEFFTSDMRGVLGEGGGAAHAMVGTLMVTATAGVISIPIGIMTAIYLIEYGGKSPLARAVTFLTDVMTGIPSIVAGLFAFAFFSLIFGPSVRFGFGGAVALSVLMIPVVIRSVEEMLKLVPNELREASYALGVPKWLTIIKVVLPTAAAGIAAGVTIAIARVIGETAPLLIIAGSTANTNWNVFDGREMTLPVFVYESFMIQGANPEPSIDRAWAAALTLMIIVLILNLVARFTARIFGTQKGR